MASAFPDLTAAQIKERILNGVDPIGQIGNNSLKPTLTNGRLNIAKALAGAAPEKDNKPPAAVGNLAAAATTFQSVALTWTATGDDGSAGRASFYDIRYATSPITKGTWDTDPWRLSASASLTDWLASGASWTVWRTTVFSEPSWLVVVSSRLTG